MSFIAYAQNLEMACRMVSYSKQVNLTENHNDKNRIYLSGTSIMSTKLTVSMAQCKKLCEQVVQQELLVAKVKRSNFLEKQGRNFCMQKMKANLQAVMDLQQKYVELPEYKKFSCINIDAVVPEIKVSQSEEEEGLSDAKYEQLKINRRKRRRYKNSFLNPNNLVQWTEDELNASTPKNKYQGTTMQYFESREKNWALCAMNTLIKPEQPYVSSADKNRTNGSYYQTGIAYSGQPPSQFNMTGSDLGAFSPANGALGSQNVQSRYLNSITESQKLAS